VRTVSTIPDVNTEDLSTVSPCPK